MHAHNTAQRIMLDSRSCDRRPVHGEERPLAMHAPALAKCTSYAGRMDMGYLRMQAWRVSAAMTRAACTTSFPATLLPASFCWQPQPLRSRHAHMHISMQMGIITRRPCWGRPPAMPALCSMVCQNKEAL